MKQDDMAHNPGFSLLYRGLQQPRAQASDDSGLPGNHTDPKLVTSRARSKMARKCAYCGRFFVPDYRTSDRQKSCGRRQCQKARKSAAQAAWSKKNPDYFKNRYGYVKEWREKNNTKRPRVSNGRRKKVIRQQPVLPEKDRTKAVRDGGWYRKKKGSH